MDPTKYDEICIRDWDVHAVTRLGYPYDRWDPGDHRHVNTVDHLSGVHYHRLLDGRRVYRKWPIGFYVDEYTRRVEQLVRAHQIGIIHGAGGLASLAHPGRTRIDSRIKALSLAGLDAIEVYHSDHDKETVERYHRMASELGLLMTGGSDFHGDPTHGIEPGTSTLPADEWQRLNAARRRHVVE